MKDSNSMPQVKNQAEIKYCDNCGAKFKTNSHLVSNKTGKRYTIFVSHAEVDKKIVACFCKMLEAILHPHLGLRCRIFRSSASGYMKCGEDVKKRIHSELNHSRSVFCILTKKSHIRPWVLYEMGYAVGYAQGKSSAKHLMPIAIGIGINALAKGCPFATNSITRCNRDGISSLTIQLLNQVVPNFSKGKHEDQLKKSFEPHIKTFLDEIKREMGK